jgi:hypothetical protein
MKTKPILIIIVVVILLVCGFLFIRSKYLSKPEKGEIAQFLNAFNAHVRAGNIDSASAYFEDNQKSKLVKVLLSVLTNKTNTGGKEKPIFKVSLNTGDALIKFTNPEFATALIAVTFRHEGLPAGKSALLFTIHKIAGKQYKITQVDAVRFAKDYSSYQVKVYNKITPEADIYSPQTLAAFKEADKLKTRYDSVLWFQHYKGQAFYYVIKGKVKQDFYWPEENVADSDKSDFKMGLVNPQLKEIIPVEYDLIHNIGGTIKGLIEVEKKNEKGFYDIAGRVVLPAEYEQIYPLKGTDNLALLKKGDGYYYFKADSTVSDKISDFKITDFLPQIKTYGESYELSEGTPDNIMEYNSKDRYTSIIVTPSYLVDWKVLDKFLSFQNPLRKLSDETMGDGDGSRSLSISFSGNEHRHDDNWFENAFYTVVDDYLGGRSGLYTSKKLLLVDKKQNRLMGFSASNFFGNLDGEGRLSGACNENYLKAINDSLFEFKTTAGFYQPLLDSTKQIEESPYYHYLQIKNGKLIALKTRRLFPTQFVKLDDSYLQGCYVIGNNLIEGKSGDKTIDHATKEILQVMKNEIYASYNYKFKNPRWDIVFGSRFDKGNGVNGNANVDDSLTVIDKYNISFINSKLNTKKANTLASK